MIWPASQVLFDHMSPCNLVGLEELRQPPVSPQQEPPPHLDCGGGKVTLKLGGLENIPSPTVSLNQLSAENSTHPPIYQHGVSEPKGEERDGEGMS